MKPPRERYEHKDDSDILRDIGYYGVVTGILYAIALVAAYHGSIMGASICFADGTILWGLYLVYTDERDRRIHARETRNEEIHG